MAYIVYFCIILSSAIQSSSVKQYNRKNSGSSPFYFNAFKALSAFAAFAAASFFGFKLQAGIDVLLDTVHFEELAADADMVFTGEGRLDSQTLGGKVVSGIGNRAKVIGVPVIAVVGGAKAGAEAIYDHGVTAIFTTNRLAEPFDPDPEKCKRNLEFSVDNIIRLLNGRK